MSRTCSSRAGLLLNSTRPARTSTGTTRPVLRQALASSPGQFSLRQLLEILTGQSRRAGGIKCSSAFFPINCARSSPFFCNTQPSLVHVQHPACRRNPRRRRRRGEFFKQVAENAARSFWRSSPSVRTRSSAPPHWSAERSGAVPDRAARRSREDYFG